MSCGYLGAKTFLAGVVAADAAMTSDDTKNEEITRSRVLVVFVYIHRGSFRKHSLKRASWQAEIDVCFNAGICIQIAESLHSEMRSFHPIHVLRMFSRNRFKALEFMKNLKAPGKCEASGEVKSRLYTQKGHLSH